jgi:Tfp pilus assembly protein PilX
MLFEIISLVLLACLALSAVTTVVNWRTIRIQRQTIELQQRVAESQRRVGEALLQEGEKLDADFYAQVQARVRSNNKGNCK